MPVLAGLWELVELLRSWWLPRRESEVLREQHAGPLALTPPEEPHERTPEELAYGRVRVEKFVANLAESERRKEAAMSEFLAAAACRLASVAERADAMFEALFHTRSVPSPTFPLKVRLGGCEIC